MQVGLARSSTPIGAATLRVRGTQTLGASHTVSSHYTWQSTFLLLYAITRTV